MQQSYALTAAFLRSDEAVNHESEAHKSRRQLAQQQHPGLGTHYHKSPWLQSKAKNSIPWLSSPFFTSPNEGEKKEEERKEAKGKGKQRKRWGEGREYPAAL